MRERKSYSQELSDRRNSVSPKQDDPLLEAIRANTALLTDIKHILLMVAENLLDQEEEQESSEYLDGSPL